jgi:hypothetical protein
VCSAGGALQNRRAPNPYAAADRCCSPPETQSRPAPNPREPKQSPAASCMSTPGVPRFRAAPRR